MDKRRSSTCFDPTSISSMFWPDFHIFYLLYLYPYILFGSSAWWRSVIHGSGALYMVAEQIACAFAVVVLLLRLWDF